MSLIDLGLNDPKEITIDDKKFTISIFPAVPGRLIFVEWTGSALPKIGDAGKNQEMMREMMKYVAVPLGTEGRYITLKSDGLINEHTGRASTLMKLEWAIYEYNFGFFLDGGISTILENFATKARQWVTEILTVSSAPSSQKVEQPSTN